MSTIMEQMHATKNASAGKYLTFRLHNESYGIAVLKIREIIRLQDITPVPQMPCYIKGVINLRGKIIPVVDLRIKFGMPEIKDTERTCIIVVQVASQTGQSMMQTLQMGLIVDAVEEVLNINSAEMENTPEFGTKLDTEYILGMAKAKGAVIILLDIDKVLTASTLESLGQSF
jgi:purine-binding chemotaxis protein CheW